MVARSGELEWQAERSRRMKARVLALAEPTVVSDATRRCAPAVSGTRWCATTGRERGAMGRGNAVERAMGET